MPAAMVAATAVIPATTMKPTATTMKPTATVTATLCNKWLGSDEEGDEENCRRNDFQHEEVLHGTAPLRCDVLRHREHLHFSPWLGWGEAEKTSALGLMRDDDLQALVQANVVGQHAPLAPCHRLTLSSYNRAMANRVIHISEEEAASDFASVLARVRAGAEVVIESDARAVAVLRPVAEMHGRRLSESIALAEAHARELGYEPTIRHG